MAEGCVKSDWSSSSCWVPPLFESESGWISGWIIVTFFGWFWPSSKGFDIAVSRKPMICQRNGWFLAEKRGVLIVDCIKSHLSMNIYTYLVCVYLYIYIYLQYTHIFKKHIYIYLYTYRENIYIYIHTHTENERERERERGKSRRIFHQKRWKISGVEDVILPTFQVHPASEMGSRRVPFFFGEGSNRCSFFRMKS